MKLKTVLITGCSSGIGRCVALGLQQRGHHVVASVRSEHDIQSLQSTGLHCIKLDLSDSSSIKKGFEQALSLCDGRIDVLFNNGAYGQPGAVEDLNRDVLRQQFETNLFGTMELTNLVIPIMRKQGSGRIIQNSSVLGFVALPFRGAYNASKFALEGITDTLRLELHNSGIFVSLILPGPVDSRFRANAFKMYQQNIDRDHSIHREKYLKTEKRLTTSGPAVPFTLPPEAVLKKVIHAIENSKPKVRYFVTFPTYLFSVLKWLTSDRLMDAILRKVSSSENR